MKIKDRQFSFPYPFKFVGLGLIILTVLAIVFVKKSSFNYSPEDSEIIKSCIFGSFILGFSFFAFGDERLEDEMTRLLKTKAFAGGFAGAIVYVIIKPFINLASNIPMEVSGYEVALVMLLGHILTYYLQKFTGKE